MSDLVRLSREREVLIVTVENPPVNVLSPGVAEAILSAIGTAERDGAVKAIILIGGGRTFIAGADIKEFVRMTAGERDPKVGLYPLMTALEDSSRPVVCAIHGTALGGGLEIAMACHYRLAVPSARIGQPEVRLGLIPGAGGTQRLPRLAGVAKALEMCTQGDSIGAPEALDLGIVDKVVEGDLLSEAVGYARSLLARNDPIRKTRDRSEKLGNESANRRLFACAREGVRDRDRGRIAPLKAIEAIEAATRLPFDQGIAREEQLFEDCLFSAESRSLIHVFFGEREVMKVPGIPKDAPVMQIRKAAIIGAGAMGCSLAAVYAGAGIPVILKDVSGEALDRGLTIVRDHFESAADCGRMTPQNRDERMSLIRPALNYEGIAEADIAIEAVGGDLEVRLNTFHELDRVCWPEAILAATGSILDIDSLAAATSRPFKVIGHHFSSLPHVARVIEIVRGRATAPDVVVASMAIAKRLRKTGVVVGNGHGWIGSRMRERFAFEIQTLEMEGARPADIQTALHNFGMSGDSAGRKESKPDAPGDRSVSDQEIVERTVYAMINEGALILEEKVALRAVDIDIIHIHEFGFPAHRGGPMWFADTVGLPRVHKRICEFQGAYGSRWEPAALLERLTTEGRTFAQFDRDISRIAS